MRSLLVLLVFVVACGGAEPPKPSADVAATAIVAADTQKVDLGAVKTALPPAVSDSFVAPAKTPRIRIENIPDAPDPLMEAVQREEGISRFCYQEFGQKSDPKLVGAVALVVVFDAGKIWSARVGADDWSSKAGKAVNECLVDKAPQAWKLLPGAKVAPGRYVVQLRFRPT
ncbi:MAG: hypothetical protein P3B98_11615 [Gemmatimonadota bacterium]|nr:hypothetical protein [Gemmatimonadota bacterium]